MAQLTVPRSRRFVLAMKAETTYGTDIFAGTYTSADIVPAMDLQVTPNLQEIEILSTGGQLGRQLSAIGPESATVTFRMTGRGTAAAYSASVKPEATNPLQACSLAGAFTGGVGTEKWTFAPSDTHASYTIYACQENGPTWKLVGCHGDVEFSMRAGFQVEMRFTMGGLISGVSDVTFVAGSISGIQYPVAKSAAFQIGTENYAPRIANIGVRLGNVLQQVPSVNSTGGLAGFIVADRNPRVTIDPEANNVATYAWYSKWAASTLADCTFQAGTAQYNRIKFSFPTLQIVAQPSGTRDGMTSLPTTLLATVATGNDDLSIVFD